MTYAFEPPKRMPSNYWLAESPYFSWLRAWLSDFSPCSAITCVRDIWTHRVDKADFEQYCHDLFLKLLPTYPSENLLAKKMHEELRTLYSIKLPEKLHNQWLCHRRTTETTAEEAFLFLTRTNYTNRALVTKYQFSKLWPECAEFTILRALETGNMKISDGKIVNNKGKAIKNCPFDAATDACYQAAELFKTKKTEARRIADFDSRRAPHEIPNVALSQEPIVPSLFVTGWVNPKTGKVVYLSTRYGNTPCRVEYENKTLQGNIATVYRGEDFHFWKEVENNLFRVRPFAICSKANSDINEVVHSGLRTPKHQ